MTNIDGHPHEEYRLMSANTSKRRKMSSPMASAVDRWESEGGAISAGIRAVARQDRALSGREKRIFQRLGAALLSQWNDLPTFTQKTLFEHAVSMDEEDEIAVTRKRIARFLHQHKDNESSSI